jgi:hypothetical protein
MPVLGVSKPEDVAAALRHASAAEHVAVLLDPGAVLDAQLAVRLPDAVAHADALVDQWAVLCSGGIGSGGGVVDFAYYADAVHLTSSPDLTPLLIPFPGLALIRTDWCREALGDLPAARRPDVGLVWRAATSGIPSYASPRLRYGSLDRPGPGAAGEPVGWAPDTTGDEWYFPAPGADAPVVHAGSAPEAMDAFTAAAEASGLAGRVRSAARAVRPDISVSIVIRTVGGRPALLWRALEAVRDRSGGPELEVIVVSDVEDGVAAAREAVAAAALEAAVVVADQDDLPSRWRNLRAGADAASGDYVWFVDDDDHILPGAVDLIQDALPTTLRPILLVRSQAVEETWRGGRLEDVGGEPEGYPGSDWFLTFAGANRVPICSAVYPADLLRRLDWRKIATGELSEDYALFVAATRLDGAWLRFAAGGTAAHISIRNEGDFADNVVTMEDRAAWLEALVGAVGGLYDGTEPDQVLVEAVGALGSAPSDIRHIEHLESVVAALRFELRRLQAAARTDRGARDDLVWLLRRLGRGPVGAVARRRPTFRRLWERWVAPRGDAEGDDAGGPSKQSGPIGR